VTAIIKRLRPLFIGIIALIFTAGIAFAGKPSTPAAGLAVAAEHAGKTVPVVAEPGDEEGDEELNEPLENEELDEDGAGGENCAIDPTLLTPEELAAMRHGSVVCWAAHQETPEGFDNHGLWISSEFAKKNHGHEDAGDESADADGAVTLEAASGHANHGKSKKH
jgi:hypothetical protein